MPRVVFCNCQFSLGFGIQWSIHGEATEVLLGLIKTKTREWDAEAAPQFPVPEAPPLRFLKDTLIFSQPFIFNWRPPTGVCIPNLPSSHPCSVGCGINSPFEYIDCPTFCADPGWCMTHFYSSISLFCRLYFRNNGKLLYFQILSPIIFCR